MMEDGDGDGWSASQAQTLKYICGVSNILSALGCGFIVYCFLVIQQERRNYFQRLVFYLSIVDLFNAIEWLVTLGIMDESDYVCRILGPYKKYLYLASFFWTAFIASPTSNFRISATSSFPSTPISKNDTTTSSPGSCLCPSSCGHSSTAPCRTALTGTVRDFDLLITIKFILFNL